MSNWRLEASKRLPEIKADIEEAEDAIALWATITDAFRAAYFDPRNDDFIRRVYGFAAWCLEQERSKIAGNGLGETTQMGMKLPIVGTLIGLLSSDCSAKDVGIHGAARSGNLARVKKCLADDPKLISLRDGAGRTPLTAAAIAGQKEVVEFLLLQGADVNDKGFMEMTPLADMAASWGQRDDRSCTEIAEALLSHGARPNAVDRYGVTPLYWAAESGHAQMIRLLLEKGADTSTADSRGQTPLHVAAVNRREDVVEILMKAKARLDVKDRGGLTPLKEMCKQPKIVEFLKAAGAPE